MAMMARFCPVVPAMAFLSAVLSAGPLEAPSWRVDRRVELAAVLCRLAGYAEFQSGRMPKYDEAVAIHFSPFKEHAAIRLMRRLRTEHDISWNAGIAPALLVDEHTWVPRVRPRPVPAYLDARWDEASLEAYLEALASFARDSRAAAFFESQEAQYRKLEHTFPARLAGQPDLAWFRAHFDVPANASFRVVPGLLTGAASYGIHVVLPDGRLEAVCVLGLPLSEEHEPLVAPVEALELIVHEFCHTFVNPWVNAHPDILRPAAEKLFEFSSPVMKAQAYATWQSLMYESLVRAATVRYLADHDQPRLITVNLDDDRSKGFWWTEELSKILDGAGDAARPMLDRDRERIRSFFEEWARDPGAGIARVQASLAARRAELLHRGPQILSLTPPDGDMAVDPAISLLELRFDRPMTGALSFYGTPLQLAGKPSWSEDKTVLWIPVNLKAGMKYIVGINRDEDPGGFRSTAGEKLTPRTWTFVVK